MQHSAAIVLTNLGLSVIVEAIDLSRKIFRRMKKYVISRTACTLQLLVFSYLATLCVDPETVIAEISPMGHPGKLLVGKMRKSSRRCRRWNAVTLEISCWNGVVMLTRLMDTLSSVCVRQVVSSFSWFNENMDGVGAQRAVGSARRFSGD